MCLAQGHNTMTPVRLKPTTPQFRVNHFTTELLRSHFLLQHLLLSWASGFSIEPATNCDYDYVKVYAAGSSNTQQGNA